MSEHTCNQHTELMSKIDSLCRNQVATTTTLDLIAKSLAKLEDTNLHLTEIRGKLLEIEARYDKTERAHDDIFTRLREIENIGSGARLNKIEANVGNCPGLQEVKKQQDRLLWGGLVTIGLALIGALMKVAWGKL